MNSVEDATGSGPAGDTSENGDIDFGDFASPDASEDASEGPPAPEARKNDIRRKQKQKAAHKDSIDGLSVSTNGVAEDDQTTPRPKTPSVAGSYLDETPSGLVSEAL